MKTKVIKGKLSDTKNVFTRFFNDCPIKIWDILIALFFMAICFFGFEMADLYHTAGCSYGYLTGHFFDFYDYLHNEAGLNASYMPSVYLVFAVWNIPMRLFGIVNTPTMALSFIPIMWAKLLPCLTYLASGILVYKISVLLSMGERKAKICTYAYLTIPVALFGQFLLGQYESFLVFFILLGVYYWFLKKNVWFIFWFAVAITFKYTALLIFLPLLLLREKNIWKILLSVACVFAFFALEYLLYMHSEIFRSYAFGIGSSGDNPTGYITNAYFYTGFNLGSNQQYVVYLTYLAFAFVMAYAYFKKVDEKSEGQYAFYLATLSVASFFCFSKFHPQWLLLAVPFWTISAFLHKDTKIFMALDLLYMILLVIFSTTQFVGITDEVLLQNGIFKYLLPDQRIGSYQTMREYLNRIDPSVILTLLTAITAVFAFCKHPKFLAEDPSKSVDKTMGWIRARYIVGLLVFLIPAFLCLYHSVNSRPVSYRENYRKIFVNVNDDSVYSQDFIANGTSVSKIKFPVSVGENPGEGTLTVSLIDGDTVLSEKEFTLSSLFEGELVSFPVNQSLTEGKTYTVSFGFKNSQGTTFSLLASDEGENYSSLYVNPGSVTIPLNSHIAMEVYQ